MKTIFKRASKSTLAVVLTLCLLFSCMTVGIMSTSAASVDYVDDWTQQAQKDVAAGAQAVYDASVGASAGESVGATARTVYITPASVWSNYKSTDTIKICSKPDKNNGWDDSNLATQDMTDTGKTYNGNKVFSGSYYVDGSNANNNFNYFKIMRWEGSTWKEEIVVNATGGWGNDAYNGKLCTADGTWLSSWSYDVVKTPLTTPTLSATGNTGTEDSSANVTFTIGNYSTITAEDSDATFKLYKDGNEVSGVTFNSSGVATIAKTVANNGDYKVKAFASASDKSDSDYSSPDVSVSLTYGARTVYLWNENSWSAITSCYTFDSSESAVGGSWPGSTAVTKIGTKDGKAVYSFTLDAATYGTAEKLIIVNGNTTNQYPGSNNGGLTITDGHLYSNKDGDEGAFNPSTGLDVYTIAGTKEMMGGDSDFETTRTANDMTDNGDGTYTLVVTGVPAGTYDYKVVRNHAWGAGEYPSSGNQSVTVANANSTITFTYNPTASSDKLTAVVSGGNYNVTTSVATAGTGTAYISTSSPVSGTDTSVTLDAATNPHTVYVLATPVSGYCVSGWQKDGVAVSGQPIGTDNSAKTASFSVTEPVTISPVFSPLPTAKTFYVAKSHSYSWSNIYYYLYGGDVGNSSSFPGTKITSTQIGTYMDAPVYKVTTDATNCTKIILSDGTSNHQYQNDVAFVAGTLYYTRDTGAAPSTIANFDEANLDKTVTVSCDNGTFSDDTTADKTIHANAASDAHTGVLPIVNAPSGYRFKQWNVTTGSVTITVNANDGTGRVTATGNGTVTAEYELIPYELGLKLNNVDQPYQSFTNGSLSATLAARTEYELWIQHGDDFYKHNTAGYSITRSDSGSALNFTSGNQANTKITTDLAGTYTFTWSATRGDPINVTVTYPAETNYTVTFANGDHGTVSPSSASVSDATGYDLSQVTVTPTGNYKFNGTWTVTSGTGTISDGKLYPTSNCTVTPTYEAVPHVYAVGSKFGNDLALSNTSYEMTYDAASDAYYITTVPVSGEDNYFRFNTSVDGSTATATKIYNGNGGNSGAGWKNFEIGSSASKSTVEEITSYNDKGKFYFDFNNGDHISGATYKIWFDLNNMKAWAEIDTMNIYLTGWLNGGSVTTTDDSRKFTKQQDGTYTLDYTFTGNQGGSQYVTIFDGTNAYHPVTHKSGTGTAGTTVNTSPGADPKWQVDATTDQTAHFTYNPNTKVLSWTVDSLAPTYRVVGSATFFGTAWDTTTASSSYNYMMGATNGTETADGTSFTYDYRSGPHTASVAYGSFDFKVFGTNNTWNPSANVTVPGLKKDQQIYFYFNSGTGAVTYAIVGSGTEDPWPPTDITTLNPGDVQYNSLIYNISGGSNNITTNKSTLDGLKQVKSVADAGNGGWWADFTDLLPSIGTNQLYFNITSNGNYTGFYSTSNMTFDTTNAPGISVKKVDKDSSKYFVEVSGVDSALTHLGVYITKDGSNNFTYKFYTVKAAASAVKTVKIYAKDGAIRRLGTARDPRSNMTYSTFEQHANTFVYSDQAMTQHIGTRSSTHGASGNDELTDTNVFDRYTYDYVAKQNKGTTIYIKTVLDSTYIQQQYYVKGFSINGTVYNLYSYNNTGVYTEAFTIPEDWAKNYVEITPIFQKVENADNVIRFYVEGFDKEVQDAGWGDTLGVYPFYQNEATNAYVGNINNPFGGYPGQPMIFYKGNYYIELPKSYQTNDEGGGTYTATIKGVTLSNMYWDDVHLYTGEVNTHMQTYDFDDLYKIYKEYGSSNEFDKIVCAFKYRTKKNNDEPNAFDTSKVSDYTNGWELLKNYKGEAIDVFGNVLYTAEQTAALTLTASSSDVVHIISQDYKSNSAGDYATEWAIYDTTGAKITGGGKNTIVPSALEIAPVLVSGSSNDYTAGFEKYDAQTRAFKNIYNNLYNDQDVLGKPAFITYEKSIYGGGDKADRCDARWFFSRKELVNAKVLIEYSDDLGKTWTADAFNGQATGTHTGCTAYFEGISADADNTVDSGKAYPDYTTDTTGKTPTSTIGDGYYVFNSASAGQYEFVGWYVLRDNYLLNAGKNNYVSVTGNFPSHAEIAKNGDIFVVRYIKTAHGSFTINHEVHPQSTGFGDVYVQAVVKNAGNTLKTYGDGTDSHITIPTSDSYINNTDGNIIEARFTPDPYGTSSFVNFYATVDALLKDFNEYDYIKSIELVNMPGSEGYNANNTTYALVTYDVNKLFVGGTQKYTSVTHYSKFTLKTDVNYKLYYTFNTRYYGTKNYEYDQSFTEQELRSYFYDQITQKNVSTIKIDKQFVYSKAPFESNYREDLTWDVNLVEVSENTGRLTATQVKKKTVRATFYDVQNVNNSCVVVTNTYTTPYMKVFDVVNTCPAVTSRDFDSFPAADCALYQPKLTTYYNETTEANEPVYIDHWDIYRLDTITFVRDAQNNYMFEEDGINIKVDAKSDLVAKCYSPEFNYAGFDDYAVIPVYSKEYHNQQQASDALPQTGSATLLTITRNHWNNTTDGNKTEYGAYDEPNTNYDRIYVDFMLNYNYKENGKNILLNSINDNNIVVGFVVKSYTWEDDGNGGQRKAYRSKNGTPLAQSVVIEKSKIDNKNRIEYCYGFSNTQNNSQYGLNFEFTPFVIDTNETGGSGITYNGKAYTNMLENPTILQNVNFYQLGKQDTPWN